MNAIVTTAGLIVLILGLAGAAGAIPLSVTASTVISGVSVSCPSGSCTASASIQNVNVTSAYLPLQVWFTVTDSSNRQVQSFFQNANIPPGSNQVLSQALGNLATGAYTLGIFVLTNNGITVSTLKNQAFGTGTYTLTMRTDRTVISAPPPGDNVYPYGTKVKISWNQTQAQVASMGSFKCFNVNQVFSYSTSNVGCFSQNPYTITMNANYEVQIILNQLASQQSYTVTPVATGCACISPATAQNVYPSGLGPSSATFTATPKTGYSFSGWSLYGTSFKNTTNPLTLTYTQLTPYVTASSNANLQLFGNFVPLPYLQILAVNGVTTTPAAGVNYYPLGTKVTVTESVSGTTCFKNWILDGVNMGSDSSITVTIDQAHVLNPNAGPCPTLSINTAGGVTTVPVPGTYTYTTPQTVTVQITPNSGYCISDVVLDGKDLKAVSSVTVTMDVSHSLSAAGQVPSLGLCSTTTTSTTTIGGPGGNGGGGVNPISFVFIILGGIVTAVGLKSGKGVPE